MSRFKLPRVQWIMVIGAVVGGTMGAGSVWRERLEGRGGDLSMLSRALNGAVGGVVAAIILKATSPLRAHGRLGYALSWVLAGIGFLLCFLPATLAEGTPLIEGLILVLLLGIGGGLSMAVLEYQLRS